MLQCWEAGYQWFPIAGVTASRNGRRIQSRGLATTTTDRLSQLSDIEVLITAVLLIGLPVIQSRPGLAEIGTGWAYRRRVQRVARRRDPIRNRARNRRERAVRDGSGSEIRAVMVTNKAFPAKGLATLSLEMRADGMSLGGQRLLRTHASGTRRLARDSMAEEHGIEASLAPTVVVVSNIFPHRPGPVPKDAAGAVVTAEIAAPTANF